MVTDRKDSQGQGGNVKCKKVGSGEKICSRHAVRRKKHCKKKKLTWSETRKEKTRMRTQKEEKKKTRNGGGGKVVSH